MAYLITSRNVVWPFLLVQIILLCGCKKSLDDDYQDITIPLYCIENDLTHSYLSEADYDNEDYTYTFMNKYHGSAVDYRKDCPNPIHVTWSPLSENSGELELLVKDNQNTLIRYAIPSGDSSFDLFNLIPGKEYELILSVKGSQDNVVDVFPKRFKTTGKVRMLFVDGLNVGNIRDIGGWRTKEGREIVYGRLYRGGELLYSYPGYTQIVISEKGINTIVNELKIDVEIDFGDVSNSSPIAESGVDFIHGDDYQIASYVKGLSDKANRSKYANCLKIISECIAEGKVVYFHCNGGADRTGTLALIIEALLGVSEQDIARDYELTCFSVLGNIRYRNQDSYRQLVDYIKSHFTGNDFNEMVYKMCVSPVDKDGLGLDINQIMSLRTILTEDKIISNL